jgi:hypothetical protein
MCLSLIRREDKRIEQILDERLGCRYELQVGWNVPRGADALEDLRGAASLPAPVRFEA